MSITRNKNLEAQTQELTKEISMQKNQIENLQTETFDLTSKIRELNIENHLLKMRVQKYEPDANISTLSNEEIESSKDAEIRDLHKKISFYEQQLTQMKETSTNSGEYTKLKSEFEELKKLNESNEVKIEELLQQIKLLQQVKRTEGAVTTAADVIGEDKAHLPEMTRTASKFAADTQEFVKKRFEFENLKKQLTEENAKLNNQNKNLLSDLKLTTSRLEDLQNRYQATEKRITLLEGSLRTHQDTIKARDQHIESLLKEKENVANEAIEQHRASAGLREKIYELENRLKFLERSNEQFSKMNKELLEDKQVYLKTLLNRQKELVQIEIKNKKEINKLVQENDRLRAELATQQDLYAMTLKKNEDRAIILKMRVENQDITTTNLMKKIEVQEKIIKELNKKFETITKVSANPVQEQNPLEKITANLFVHSEENKSLESLKDLLAHQKKQFDETLRVILKSHEEISKRFFDLEDRYRKEQTSSSQRIMMLTDQMAAMTSQSDIRVKELEQKIKEVEALNKKMMEEKAAMERQSADTETVSSKELSQLRETLEKETRRANDLQKKISEEEAKIKALENDKYKAETAATEKLGYSKQRELGLVEQKNALQRQIEQLKAQEKKLKESLRELKRSGGQMMEEEQPMHKGDQMEDEFGKGIFGC